MAFSGKLRHEYYQTDTHVNVSIFVKNLKPDEVKVEFGRRSLALNISLPTGSEAVFDIDPLAHDIDAAQSSYKIFNSKIDVALAKAKPGIRWAALEGKEGVLDDSVAPNYAAATSSSHTSTAPPKPRKNWDAILAEEDDEASVEKGGEAELQSFFQKLYADADDDTKKAMMKSYMESNGTALSTNWSQVGKEKVKTEPPEGMVAKDYGR